MRSAQTCAVSLALALAAAGCAGAPAQVPTKPTPVAPVPAASVAASAQPATQPVVAAASERWFVPYFAPLRVSDSWSPVGDLTLAYGENGTSFLYQASTGAPVAPLPFGRWLPVAWSPDGRKVAALGRGELVIVDSTTRQTVAKLPAPAQGVDWQGPALLGFMPDSQRVIVLGPEGVVQVLDPKDGAIQKHELGFLRGARLAPGRAWLAYGKRLGFAIYDLEQRRELISDTRSLVPAAWFSSGQQLVATGPDYSVIFTLGQPPIEVPLSGTPTWNAQGTALAFGGPEPCQTCLRQFGLSAVFELPKRRETTSDAFVPDGPRYGAGRFGQLQDRTTGIVRNSRALPFTLEKPRLLRFEGEHTLVFEAEGWAARIDLATVQVTAAVDDGPGRVFPDAGQVVNCEQGLFSVRERFTGQVLGTLPGNCADSLRPFDGSLYELREASGEGTQVVDLSDGKVLARLSGVPLPWREHWLVGTRSDERESRCQVFDATRRRFYETAPAPLGKGRGQCIEPGVINSTGQVSPRLIFVALEGRGFLGPDGRTTQRALPFCKNTYAQGWGVACFEAGRASSKLRVFIHGKGVHTLVTPAATAMQRIELAADEQHIALTLANQAYVADLQTGKVVRSDAVPPAQPGPLPPDAGDRYEYRAAPSGRIEARPAQPVTLMRRSDGRILTLLVARLAGKVYVAAVDSTGNYAGSPELTRQLLYGQGSSVRDAVLVSDTDNVYLHPDLVQRFLAGQD